MIPDLLIFNRKTTTTQNPERIHVPATGNEQMLTLKNVLQIFLKRNKTLELTYPMSSHQTSSPPSVPKVTTMMNSTCPQSLSLPFSIHSCINKQYVTLFHVFKLG